MSWREITLGNFFEIKHGWAFKSQYFGDVGEHIVMTPGNFYERGGFRSRPGKDRFYTVEPPSDYVLHAGDLVVAMTEQGEGLLGSSALIPEHGSYLHNQRIGLVDKLDEDGLCKDFLYRLFNTPQVRGQVRSTASGTKVRHTAPARIRQIRARVPPVRMQRRIADILSAYDDLIENNRRRIALLEEAARLLYREWFVHFRFPGHEHVRTVDGVPEGWERRMFGTVCRPVGGGTPSTAKPEYWNDGDIPWYTPTDVTRNGCLALLDSERKITESGLRNSSAKILPAGTVLMTSRASVGFFGVIGTDSCTNQGFIGILPNDGHTRMYLLLNLLHRVEEIRSHAGGSTYREISKTKFKALEVLLPESRLLRDFEQQVAALHDNVRVLHSMIKLLRQGRDLMLPRLMNGEIAV